MTNFFANFKVVIAKLEEFDNPNHGIQVREDGLGGYALLVNSESPYFRDIFGEQRKFTKHERQQITLFAIGAFLKRDDEARRKYLPEVEDASGVDAAIALLTEEAYLRGEL